MKIIGIAGGSGAGKNWVSSKLVEFMGQENCALISQDSYYKFNTLLSFKKREAINYDHPNSINFSLMHSQVSRLIKGETIQQPIYCFAKHKRLQKTIEIKPKPYIIIEGILILHCKSIRELLQKSLYIEADDDIRLIRRIQRDTIERSRSLDKILYQYQKSVKPMYVQFVKPSMKYADFVIQNNRNSEIDKSFSELIDKLGISNA